MITLRILYLFIREQEANPFEREFEDKVICFKIQFVSSFMIVLMSSGSSIQINCDLTIFIEDIDFRIKVEKSIMDLIFLVSL